jgi:hypothetical protein
MSELQRLVRFEPGHTIRRSKDDGSNYGIASMIIRFLLSGEHGTTQFAMFSGWYPEKVPSGRGWNEWHSTSPNAMDLGAHWDAPWSEYMTERDGGYAHRDCDLRPSGSCWYDGSGLRAERVMEQFFLQGEDAVWALLEQEYQRIDADAAGLLERHR